MDKYTLIIILATLGFFALAAILLVPIYLFLLKEEKVSAKWTGDALAESVEKRYRGKSNGLEDESTE
ncbi:MAG: hypothetical protein HKN43_16420 [Rhodothermales bacterium]|nr:hypothetical protein [Rhodothermales bacterium]